MAARYTLAGSCRGVSLEITTFDTTKPAVQRDVGEVLEHMALAGPEPTADQHRRPAAASRRSRLDDVEELAEPVLDAHLQRAEHHHRVTIRDTRTQRLERPPSLDHDLAVDHGSTLGWRR